VLRPLDEAAARGLRGSRGAGLPGDRDRADARLALARRTRRGWRSSRAAGFTQVSVSHEVAPVIKLIGRGDTTLVDAYLSPVLRRYVDGFTRALGANGASAVHAVGRRAGRRRAVPRQGRGAVRPGGRDRRHGAHGERSAAPGG
jgi:hypothetical protein